MAYNVYDLKFPSALALGFTLNQLLTEVPSSAIKLLENAYGWSHKYKKNCFVSSVLVLELEFDSLSLTIPREKKMGRKIFFFYRAIDVSSPRCCTTIIPFLTI